MAIDMTFERREVLIREEERAEGREEGREEGRVEDIRNLMKNMNLSADDAMKALGIPEADYAKYRERLNLPA